MQFSFTSQNKLFTFAPRPAPDVPDLASIIIDFGSTNPSFTIGYIDKKLHVGKHPGFAINLASFILSLFTSHNPYTASSINCGLWCLIPYHFSYVATSFILKSALKSIIFTFLRISSLTNEPHNPCGVAVNITSTASANSSILSSMHFASTI